jgi:glycosyltransferase involved in cell wall biosynthesis
LQADPRQHAGSFGGADYGGRRVNVVIVNDFAHVNGGAAYVALASARGLRNRGARVVVFSAVGPADPELRENGVEVVCTGQNEILRDPSRLRAATQGLWNFSASAQFARLLGAFDRRNTVVHIHGWTKALSSSIVRTALGLGYGVVLTLHDYFSACPNGGFVNYRAARPCISRPLSARCVLARCDARSYPQKLWRVARQIVQERIGRIPRGIRHLIAVSDFSYEVLRPHLPAATRIYRIDYPVEMRQESPADVASNRGLVFVGRLAPEKGVRLLASCATEIGAPVTFVGDGPLRGEIAAACPQSEITGWLSRPDVIARIKAARALVFPSIWFETVGLVVLEAAAMGVPAIVSDCSAARDNVVDGVTGLWFRSGDRESLLAQLRRVEEPACAAQLGRAAFDRYWAAPGTLERHVEALEGCYRRVLEERRFL